MSVPFVNGSLGKWTPSDQGKRQRCVPNLGGKDGRRLLWLQNTQPHLSLSLACEEYVRLAVLQDMWVLFKAEYLRHSPWEAHTGAISRPQPGATDNQESLLKRNWGQSTHRTGEVQFVFFCCPPCNHVPPGNLWGCRHSYPGEQIRNLRLI